MWVQEGKKKKRFLGALLMVFCKSEISKPTKEKERKRRKENGKKKK